ncbi:fimbrial biogenesis chaperone [Deinococcus ruber]|uniref:Fimbrial chaperone n=1 Tax=Deinococcus ruber TaxID=1848197 RepID=A0A918CNK4_9DEIO|nr:fimbria/pilus periplasmic chaperone [Deinococcus ruber]GGR33461.1 fimbrial chaperone [Deinococcus ruber]
MNPFRHVCHCFALGLLLLGQGQAINLVFTPTLLNINPVRTLNVSTSVQNRDTVPVDFIVSVMRWTQQGGKDVLEPTPEVLANPPRFTLAPGHAQTIRVGLRARGSTPEATYRVVLTGTPQASTPATPTTDAATISGTVTTRYAFSLPLFVTAPGAAAHLLPTLEQSPDGLVLRWTNSGAAAASIRNSSVMHGSEQLRVGGSYVLAGSSVTLPLSLQDYPADGLFVSYVDQGQEKRERLAPPAP